MLTDNFVNRHIGTTSEQEDVEHSWSKVIRRIN